MAAGLFISGSADGHRMPVIPTMMQIWFSFEDSRSQRQLDWPPVLMKVQMKGKGNRNRNQISKPER